MNRTLFCCAVLASSAALAQGMLLPSDTSLGPLGIKYQRVTAEITDGVAVTKVEQVFVNSAPRQLEAQFVFPLPKGASLQGFYLWINGNKTKGEVLEKAKATEIYEGIVRRLQDPGLLEYVDSDVFRARVFPVPANGEQRIELVFSNVLDFSAGLYRYHYPLGASSRGAPKLPVKQDFTFTASINSKVPLRSIYSPTHRFGISRKGENGALAGMELGPGTDISKDVDLFYTVSDKAIGLTFMSYRPNTEDPGFFVALISPKAEAKGDEVIAKRVTFVMDTSGSMMGERIRIARDALKYCVQRLNPKDEFNVIRFSTDVEPLFEKAQGASEGNVKKALDFIASMEATGGTAIDEALQRALKDGEGRGERPHLVMFITDGNPTVGETGEPAIASRAKAANKGSRVFTFGVGDDLNARLLDRVAEDGHGTSEFMRDGSEFEVKVSAFYDKVSSPVLADVALDLTPFGAYDVYPKKLPDLFKGTQLVVMGRYRTPKEGTLVLNGMVNGQKKVFEYRAEASGESKTYDFVPRLWAIRKVGYLLDEIRLNGERPELKDEVVQLGKKFGIVTPYTSYLVVEDQPMNVAQNRRMDMPPPPPRPEPRPWREPAKGGEAWGPGSGLGGLGTSGGGGRGAGGVAPSAPAAAASPPPADVFASHGAAEKALKESEGKSAIAVAKKVRSMKDEEVAAGGSEPVRAVAGRTFLFRSGGWIDSEAVSGTKKSLKVKYLSDAYFALVKAKPDLKAAFALGGRLVVVIAKDTSVIVDPDEGETNVDKVKAFIK